MKKVVKKSIMAVAIVATAFLSYVIMAGTIPYLKQESAGEKFRENFSVNNFYGQDEGPERAMIIDDNGKALNERLRLIYNARSEIIMSTYDFRADTSGKQMIAALINAAGRGVKVKVLLDGLNFLNKVHDDIYFKALASSENVEIKVYNNINLLEPSDIMSRMHDKYILADDYVYIAGGRNTYDYFLGDHEGYKNYDRDVLVVKNGEGDSSVYEIKEYFNEVWNYSESKAWDGDINDFNERKVKKTKLELEELFLSLLDDDKFDISKTDYYEETFPTNKISIITNPINTGPKEAECFYGISEIMMEAKEKVIIHTPYIICNNYMYETLTDICDDTDVTLMTNSAANNGNVFGAADYVKYKDRILDTGMSVLEYDGDRSYHAKSILIDDDIAIIGTFNMDMKSTYQSTEMMIVIHSEEINELLYESMEMYHKDAKKAFITDSQLQELLPESVRFKKKILRFLVWLIDPVVRFLF